MWHPFSACKTLPAVNMISFLIKLPLWLCLSLSEEMPCLKRAVGGGAESKPENLMRSKLWSFFECMRARIILLNHISLRKTAYIRTIWGFCNIVCKYSNTYRFSKCHFPNQKLQHWHHQGACEKYKLLSHTPD